MYVCEFICTYVVVTYGSGPDAPEAAKPIATGTIAEALSSVCVEGEAMQSPPACDQARARAPAAPLPR
jgi:hypothetical protein